jgi:hypothetical protein
MYFSQNLNNYIQELPLSIPTKIFLEMQYIHEDINNIKKVKLIISLKFVIFLLS